MATYFKQVSVSYVNVPLDGSNGIDTEKFLEATEGLIKLFVVKNDMQGNVNKIRTKFLENPVQFKTLQAIVLSEKDQKNRTATQGLLWLRRGLEFTAAALRRNSSDHNEELSVSFKQAYDVTLSKFHSFLIKPVFALAMKACPYRKDFYAKLGDNLDQVMRDLEEWLAALEKLLGFLSKFYSEGQYDKGL